MTNEEATVQRITVIVAVGFDTVSGQSASSDAAAAVPSDCGGSMEVLL